MPRQLNLPEHLLPLYQLFEVVNPNEKPRKQNRCLLGTSNHAIHLICPYRRNRPGAEQANPISSIKYRMSGRFITASRTSCYHSVSTPYYSILYFIPAAIINTGATLSSHHDQYGPETARNKLRKRLELDFFKQFNYLANSYLKL